MCVNSLSRSCALLLAGALFLAPQASAVTGATHDVHRLPANDEFQSTIENRCTVCHSRERVDEAISRQADLDTLMQRMIERGAILSERDQKVLGTFWGSPLKNEQSTPAEAK